VPRQASSRRTRSRPVLPDTALPDTALPDTVRQDADKRHADKQDAAALICHLDVTPQNVVVRDGLAAGLVDFDLAGPGTALRDSYNAAMHWVPLLDPADAWPGWEGTDPYRRLRLFADAYGWDREERRRVPGLGIDAAALSYQRMRHNAQTLGGGWARMWNEGVGGLILRRRGWLEANAQRLAGALLD